MTLAEAVSGEYVLAADSQIAVVASQFNHFIVDPLEQAAIATLQRHGGKADNISRFHVPGAFELPLCVKKLAKTGRYHGIIALGAVIRGATPHFDYVCSTASSGLSAVALETEIPVSFGLLTTETIEQAIERAGTKAGNKGADCARALIEMINLLAKLETK